MVISIYSPENLQANKKAGGGMKAFRIIGNFKMGSQQASFTKETVASSRDEAIERILSVIGSKHRVKRKTIQIESVRELKTEEIEQTYVREMLEVEDGK
jgi:large subunit ribosomal protein LX